MSHGQVLRTGKDGCDSVRGFAKHSLASRNEVQGPPDSFLVVNGFVFQHISLTGPPSLAPTLLLPLLPSPRLWWRPLAGKSLSFGSKVKHNARVEISSMRCIRLGSTLC